MRITNLLANTIKRVGLLLCLTAIMSCTHAQSYTPPPGIPPYHILTTDSVYVTPANLKKNTPVMIVYFSPDCGHCQHMMFEMKPEMKKFKDIQVVMITFILPEQLRSIKTFYNTYELSKYPNFTVGTEGYSYVVQKYYQVQTTPYIAIYDKSGKLVTSFTKAPTMDELLATIKKV